MRSPPGFAGGYLPDAERLRRFLSELSREAHEETALYLTGGDTAVLLGWRDTTVDADILIVPEQDSLFRALPRLKEELQMNVEIACPSHFIPELPGWRERSLFIAREGLLSFYHYDPYAQALAKIERGHSKVADVDELMARGDVRARRGRELYEAIEPKLEVCATVLVAGNWTKRWRLRGRQPQLTDLQWVVHVVCGTPSCLLPRIGPGVA